MQTIGLTEYVTHEVFCQPFVSQYFTSTEFAIRFHVFISLDF